MRILDEINIGRMKVSIFKMGDKFSIKFEKDLNEIMIKFRDGAINEADLRQAYLSEKSLSMYEDKLDQFEKNKIDHLIDIEQSKGIQFPEII